jgi:probable F420-dependent oxidoreductase
MDFGVTFPTCEIGRDVGAIRDWVVAVEALGFSHVVALDHVLGAQHDRRDPPLWGPYDETHEFHEPMVLFGFIAALTSRIGLSTGVLVLPQRQTALVAKQAAEIDVLSGGRLRLAVGVGWNPIEYESLGTSFSDRGARIEEQIEVLRSLWSNPLVDVDTRTHRIDRAGIAPRPERQIPIWLGGYVAAARRRAARIGDGFLMSPAHPDSVRVQVDDLRQHLSAQGRDAAAFPVELSVKWCAGPSTVEAAIGVASELGLGAVTINTMAGIASWTGKEDLIRLRNPGDHIKALEQFSIRFAS